MTAGRSAAARAALLRQTARAGVWRRISAWLGISRTARAADAQAAVWAIGAAGEEATARLLAQLVREGWTIRHDLALPRSRANLDHLLIPPCGTAILIPDTKHWHRGRTTTLIRGRVHCGTEDRHHQVEAVARYGPWVADLLREPRVTVIPLLVVHGSSIPGGQLDTTARVVAADQLLPLLRASVTGRPDPAAVRALTARVDRTLRPYA